MDFKFYQDSLKFILFLFGVAVIGMCYGIVVLANKGVDVKDLIVRALDIVTIVVPPALPAAMTVGTVYAQSRLKKKSIYCISPPRINVCGKLKLVCFDKTGTLTEDGLDLWGVVDASNLAHPIHDIDHLKVDHLLKTLACCHSLTKFNGFLTGDPLDVKMFESTKWSFIDDHFPGTCKFEQVTPIVKQNKSYSNGECVEIAIVKQFTFSSSMLRMSVLCKTLNSKHMDVYTKGAPEKIIELCKKETSKFSEIYL
jgi:magnesium-transporting ATPase (P-type)